MSHLHDTTTHADLSGHSVVTFEWQNFITSLLKTLAHCKANSNFVAPDARFTFNLLHRLRE
jgi:hypothetical protein